MVEIKLHKGQLEIFKDLHRFRVAVMGRRFGKTRLGLTELVLASLRFPGEIDKLSPETVMGALPTLAQARPLLWEPLVSWAEGELAPYVAKIDRVNFTLFMRNGKPPIRIRGANDRNGDGLRGSRILYLLADEFQDWKPGIFDTVVSPAMADTPGSRALMTGTPKGKLNHLYEWYMREHTDPVNYRSFNMPTVVNPLKSLQEKVEADKLIMPSRSWRQEYYASFEEYPGKIFYDLDEDNRIDKAPGDYDQTILGVDFGDVNPAFVVWGRRSGYWYYLEGWQPQDGVPVAQPTQDSQLVRLATKWNPAITLCDPSRSSAILGIRALGREHDIPGLSKALAGYNPIEEGLYQVHSLIHQKRLLFPRVAPDVPDRGYVSPEKAYGLFSSYHRPTDPNGNVVDDKVAEGQDDHIVDASRYALSRKDGAKL